MRLHHVTNAENRRSIAAHGFRDSHRGHAAGVFLSPPGLIWDNGAIAPLTSGGQLGPDLIVYGFDLPDDTAAEFAVFEDVPDGVAAAALLTRDADGLALVEFCVPAEVANRYCVGVVELSAAAEPVNP